MSLQTFLIFLPACLALNMVLGPNNVLSMMIGAEQGLKPAAIAYLGRFFAFSILILITALGLGTLLAASAQVFLLIKFIGAAYLLWIGYQLLRSKSETLDHTSQTPPQDFKTLIIKDFNIAIANPKAILIFTAFFPQFIQLDHYWADFFTLGVSFLCLEFFAVLCYAILGAKLITVLKRENLGLINKASGVLMIVFGFALAFVKKPSA
ncbi:LysE family translocator [Acinetobacter rudis]|uniref:Homoserine/homoserine lactone efflux protein n=2 Tax=Acinetobacter rudis TaxID=632955 RepID=S3NJK0_9GAMM|nr:LysE family translocator [Acinetobacter rudis]EPF79842.1 hypothetical protein F945_00730 [Acinetobacter rudis CIP 110305]